MQVFHTMLENETTGCSILIQTVHGCESATWSMSDGEAYVTSLELARDLVLELLETGWKRVER